MTRADVSRGDIWWMDWPSGRGSEQAGRRPGLIVQTDTANHNPRYANVIAVAVSTKGRHLPFHVRLEPSPNNGLTMISFAKCEQLATISKGRLQGRLGAADADEMRRVDQALRWVLDL